MSARTYSIKFSMLRTTVRADTTHLIGHLKCATSTLELESVRGSRTTLGPEVAAETVAPRASPVPRTSRVQMLIGHWKEKATNGPGTGTCMLAMWLRSPRPKSILSQMQ